jgi:DNA-binding NarL/FixJ family response regulator
MSILFSAGQHEVFCDRPSIVIIDRHLLSRSCLARILRSELSEFDIEGIATPSEFGSIKGRQIRLVVLSIESCAMTDERVLDSLSYLRQSLPEAPVMLLTQIEEATISDAMISEVARAGVRGYITDSAPVEIALAALRLIIAGGVYFPRSVVINNEDSPGWIPTSSENTIVLGSAITVNGIATEVSGIAQAASVAFTERERQVVATLQRGLSNKIIADELNLSQNTVKVHVSRIMRKLKATNRTAAALAVQRVLSNADA